MAAEQIGSLNRVDTANLDGDQRGYPGQEEACLILSGRILHRAGCGDTWSRVMAKIYHFSVYGSSTSLWHC